jgi:hypothetical protein
MAPAYPEGLKRKVVQACEHGMLRYSASRIKTNAVFHFLESGWSNVRHEWRLSICEPGCKMPA